MNTPTKAVTKAKEGPSLIVRMASRFGIDPEKFRATIKATCFKGDVSDEQLAMLLVVAEQYHLNPFTREIFAFPDRGGIVPIVSVDGWLRIINEHPQYAGVQFNISEADEDDQWCECTLMRKDRPSVTIREYMSEVHRDTGPWKSHPRRMLRHKALVQCARVAFGFAGIFDDDEAQRMREAINVTPQRTAIAAPQALPEIPGLNQDQVEHIAELLAKTGVPDNLVLARYQVGAFADIPFDKYTEVLLFIQSQAP